eukprot:GFYU01003619.1.p1 GENE.GFYU01003619.1~~GFYU01003619.1.p1  ORF type:complete len:149 (-),score=40.67 GFYU01003619.1:260-706(-)
MGVYSDIEQVIRFINARPKPLSLYAFSGSSALKERLVKETSSGSVVFNDVMVHFGDSNTPFGGVGDAGIGKYHGAKSFYAFSHGKPVMYKTSVFDGLSNFRYPPYTAGKLRLMWVVLRSRVNPMKMMILIMLCILLIVLVIIVDVFIV